MPALGWAVAAILMLQMAMAEPSPGTLHRKAGVFSDLSNQELKAVHSFLWSKKELRLQPSRTTTMAKNTVFLIEMLLPKKYHVLRFLDKGERHPVREARAVIFFGDQEHPNVTEFAVGPLPGPCYMRALSPRPGHQSSWASRPISTAEYALLYHTLQEATKPLHQFFLNTTGFSFQDCHDRCLAFTDVAPRGVASGQRRSWLIIQRYVEGYFLHPTGLELLVDHGSTDARHWAVEQVWYNGKFYGSPEELARKYADGEVDVVVLEDPLPGGKGHESTEEPPLFSSHKRRGDFPSPTHVSGPRLVQPHGPRFRLEGNAVLYGGWSFAFRLPLCLFEMPTGVPLRRHFNSNFKGGFNFYAGLKGQVLVLRTTSTVYNYDYIWDFIFYPNGVMEAKMHATGYVHATFYTPEGLRHGTRLHTHLIGNIHTHLVHYRVDLDVAGTKNSFQTLQMKLENITNPWSPRHRVVQPTLEQTQYSRERQAAFRFKRKLPRYLLFTSPQENPWGHKRSYRLQIHSMADQVLPPAGRGAAITWAEGGQPRALSQAAPPLPGRYPLAVTKYRESELCSSSIYHQNDPWDPPVVFEKFLHNNENIENEDLVAWVTVGFLHIPHSEDIPNTATPGNSVGFLLRPFNFFPEDPSLASRDTVIVWPRDNGPNYVQRWIPEDRDCSTPPPFSYNGTYRPV
uniref:Amine oxidase n=1 Tax=Nomascus leucogenys TaxID=61853 RepID=G1QUW2_NOMLE